MNCTLFTNIAVLKLSGRFRKAMAASQMNHIYGGRLEQVILNFPDKPSSADLKIEKLQTDWLKLPPSKYAQTLSVLLRC